MMDKKMLAWVKKDFVRLLGFFIIILLASEFITTLTGHLLAMISSPKSVRGFLENPFYGIGIVGYMSVGLFWGLFLAILLKFMIRKKPVFRKLILKLILIYSLVLLFITVVIEQILLKTFSTLSMLLFLPKINIRIITRFWLCLFDPYFLLSGLLFLAPFVTILVVVYFFTPSKIKE